VPTASSWTPAPACPASGRRRGRARPHSPWSALSRRRGPAATASSVDRSKSTRRATAGPTDPMQRGWDGVGRPNPASCARSTRSGTERRAGASHDRGRRVTGLRSQQRQGEMLHEDTRLRRAPAGLRADVSGRDGRGTTTVPAQKQVIHPHDSGNSHGIPRTPGDVLSTETCQVARRDRPARETMLRLAPRPVPDVPDANDRAPHEVVDLWSSWRTPSGRA